MKKSLLVILGLMCLLGGNSYSQSGKGSQYLVIDILGMKPGRYVISFTIGADGSTSVPVPLPVTRLGQTPTDPVIPNQGSLSSQVSKLTKGVSDPEKTQNAAGLSVIYSVVGSKVADGKSTGAEGLAQLKSLTDGFLKARGVEANWSDWRSGVGVALTAERTAGRLTTDAQIAAALTTIADSLAGDGRALAKIEKRKGKIKLKGLIKVLLAVFADGGDFDFTTILKLILGILG